MHSFLAAILIAVSVFVGWRAYRNPSPLSIFNGVISLFSIAYYGLPTILIERSTLRYLPEAELTAMILMALIFMLSVLCGTLVSQARFKGLPGLKLDFLDYFLDKYWWAGTVASNSIVILYTLGRTLTFYQTKSVEEFYETQSSYAGFLGFVISLIQALSAIYLARAIAGRARLKCLIAGLGILVQMALVLNAGQRLIFITPAILVFAALVAQRSYREAASAFAIGIAALLLVSPFSVALRYGTWNGTQDVEAKAFTYGDNPVDSMLQSIVDRADILETMAALKAHVDANGHPGPLYYYSVLVVPIPRFLYRNKPFPISSDGTLHGQAPVLVWHLLMGPTLGSLTSFGSIIAYREGGWLWVPINGFLTGILYAILLLGFSRGGIVAQSFFALAFLRWSVAKVSPSLMEMMSDVMTYLPVIIVLLVINRLLEGQTISMPKVSPVWDDPKELSHP